MEKGTCCVADQFCTAAANFEPRQFVSSKCFACGDFVCLKCSQTIKYYDYGKQRLCNTCLIEYDGNNNRVMRRLHQMAGYNV